MEQRKFGPIENNPNGVRDLRQFLSYAITKGSIEVMFDRDDPDTFFTIILESTPISRTGTGFKLRPKYGQNLPDYYETGILKFRKKA